MIDESNVNTESNANVEFVVNTMNEFVGLDSLNVKGVSAGVPTPVNEDLV